MYTTQHTLIKDLSPNEEILFQSLGKHLRKHIRKCEREHEANIEFYTSYEIISNKSILLTCKKLYEKMFADKGMNVKFNLKLAELYCKNNALVVGIAYIDDIPVGFTSLIYDSINARAWVGAFDFRNTDKNSYTLSRAHRLLNWKRMIWCKEQGIQQFDFGGINSFDKPNTIAKFKLEFEPENKVTYYNYLVPNNIIGKIALKCFLKGRG